MIIEYTCTNKLKISTVNQCYLFNFENPQLLPCECESYIHEAGNPLHGVSWCIVIEWIRTPDSSSVFSDQQSVGSSLSRGTCVPKQDT